MKKYLLSLCVAVTCLSNGALRADVAAGQTAYAARGCIGCHGVGGVSAVEANPTLKGRDAAFIRQNLTDYRSGARKHPVMNAMAAGLSDADIDNIADYIDSLK
ncbi:MAG: cytochrome c [Gammaproteobacteria bacterium]|nr:cytochrome c [Gammaproteobacteria bacterium]